MKLLGFITMKTLIILMLNHMMTLDLHVHISNIVQPYILNTNVKKIHMAQIIVVY